MNKYPNEVEMIDDTKANIFGIEIDIIEWAEALIDPKSLIKLRNVCRNFWNNNDYNSMSIINVKKSTQYRNAYRVLISNINQDENACNFVAFPVTLQVILDKNKDVAQILIENDDFVSFMIYEKEIRCLIENHFSNYNLITKETL